MPLIKDKTTKPVLEKNGSRTWDTNKNEKKSKTKIKFKNAEELSKLVNEFIADNIESIVDQYFDDILECLEAYGYIVQSISDEERFVNNPITGLTREDLY